MQQELAGALLSVSTALKAISAQLDNQNKGLIELAHAMQMMNKRISDINQHLTKE